MIIQRDKYFATTGVAYQKKVDSYIKRGMSEEDAKNMLALRDLEAQKLLGLRKAGKFKEALENKEITDAKVDYYTKHLGTHKKKSKIREVLADQRSLKGAIQKTSEKNIPATPETSESWASKNKGLVIGSGVGIAATAGGYKLYKKHKKKKEEEKKNETVL